MPPIRMYFRGHVGYGFDVDSAVMDAIRKAKLAEHWAADELHVLAVAR